MAILSKTQWTPDTAGEQALLEQLADGLDAFAQESADVIARMAPVRKDGRKPDSPPYRATIHAATYLNGKLRAGQGVEASGFVPDKASLHSIVYTTSQLGPLLEITGAKYHEIPQQRFSKTGNFFVNIPHPGFTRIPHFAPGIMAAARQAGELMGRAVKGKVRA